MTDSPTTIVAHIRQCIESAVRLSELKRYTEAAVVLRLSKPLMSHLNGDVLDELSEKHSQISKIISQKILLERSELQKTIAAAADPSIENESATQLLWWMEQTQKNKEQETNAWRALAEYREVAERERMTMQYDSQMQSELLAKQRLQFEKESALRTKALQDISQLKEKLQDAAAEKQVLASEVRSLHSELERAKRASRDEIQKLTQKLAQKDHDLHAATEKLHHAEGLNQRFSERVQELQNDLLRASDALHAAESEDQALARLQKRLVGELASMQNSLGSERALREALHLQFKHKQLEVQELRRSMSPVASTRPGVAGTPLKDTKTLYEKEKAERKRLKQELDQMAAQLKDANFRVAAAEQALQTQIQQHVGEFRKKLQQALDAERDVRLNSEKQAAESAQQVRDLQTRFNQLWLARIATQDAMEQQKSEYEQKISRILEEVAMWREKSQSADIVIRDLRDQVSEMMHAQAQLASLNALSSGQHGLCPADTSVSVASETSIPSTPESHADDASAVTPVTASSPASVTEPSPSPVAPSSPVVEASVRIAADSRKDVDRYDAVAQRLT